MEAWHAVPSRSKQQRSSQANNEDAVKAFLSSFKVKQCHIKERHAWPLCFQYHNRQDQRRNPYVTPYEAHNAENQVEVAYHPSLFKTRLCRETSCLRGKLCAFAHAEHELRYPEEQPAILPASDGRKLSDFIVTRTKKGVATPEPATTIPILAVPHKITDWTCPRCTTLNPFLVSQCASCGAGHLELMSKCITEPFRPTPKQKHFMPLIQGIQKMFAEKSAIEGVKVDFDSKCGDFCRFRGLADNVKAAIASSCIVLDEAITKSTQNLRQTFPERLFEEEPLQAVRQLLRSAEFSRLYIKIDPSAHSICVCYLLSDKRDVEVLECIACGDKFNDDQGLLCPNKHLLCLKGCLELYLRVELPKIRSQNGELRCSMCKSPFQIHELGSKIGEAAFTTYTEAKLDARVEVLQREFNDRLAKKVEEIRLQYAERSGDVTAAAQTRAAEARDLLNLTCPHCGVVYAEFDGCMALKCGTCSGAFCGYCHRGFPSSEATHQHVRTCDLNQSPSGSFYANSSQIARGQALYRRNVLNKYLGRWKREERNAIVIELSRDLIDLGIDPDGFFLVNFE